MLFQEQDLSASKAQLRRFEDYWRWDQKAQETYDYLMHESSKLVPKSVATLIEAFFKAFGRSDMSAYLVMMAVRLVELHRVLKPTGSLYLHCDPTASHYLKLVLDAVFGAENFRSELAGAGRVLTTTQHRVASNSATSVT